MQKEYSRNREIEWAFTFMKDEMEAIARALPAEIRRLEKQIIKIEDDPKNEGQATYLAKIRDLKLLIENLHDIRKNFKNHATT